MTGPLEPKTCHHQPLVPQHDREDSRLNSQAPGYKVPPPTPRGIALTEPETMRLDWGLKLQQKT